MHFEHPLDIPHIRDEPDTSGLNRTSTSHGDFAAENVHRWLSQSKSRTPRNPTYLALGVGQAYPEVAFAKHFGVRPQRTVMVDRKFSNTTLQRLAQEFKGVNLVKSGIFAYLTHSSKSGFSWVSAFGIEYVFKRDNAPQIFLQAIVRKVTNDGIIIIDPYTGEDIDRLWEKAGFTVVMGYDGPYSPLMYVKSK